MRSSSLRFTLALAAVALLAVPLAQAALVQQMNLDEMCQRAHTIYRGTVVEVTHGTVKAGGGALPTVTYTVRVDEALKGRVDGDGGFTELTMLGTIEPRKHDGLVSYSALPEMPVLRVGGEYLLLTTEPSAAGLSAPVGLTQGSFLLEGKPGAELAVNGIGNLGLFTESQVRAPEGWQSGPVPYSLLADSIRDAVSR